MNEEHQTKVDAPTATPDRGRSSDSIPDLIRHLATDVSSLISKEIELAKREVGESVSEAQAAVGGIATGAAIAMAGLVVLLMSAVYGLSNIVDPWLAALIVGAAALLIGFIMVSSARKKMSANSMMPDRTIASARKDTETLKRATR